MCDRKTLQQLESSMGQNYGRFFNNGEQRAGVDGGFTDIRCRAEMLEVVIHPQSMAHSFVQFIDGSISWTVLACPP